MQNNNKSISSVNQQSLKHILGQPFFDGVEDIKQRINNWNKAHQHEQDELHKQKRNVLNHIQKILLGQVRFTTLNDVTSTNSLYDKGFFSSVETTVFNFLVLNHMNPGKFDQLYDLTNNNNYTLN